MPDENTDALRARIIEALRKVYDPELPVNIYDLGLIYDLNVHPSGEVEVKMTLTTPNCPAAQSFPDTVEYMLLRVPGVSDVQVELVWDPPWHRELMSEAAALQLGML